MAYRTRVFIDFWNFQLNWNDRSAGPKIERATIEIATGEILAGRLSGRALRLV